MKVYAISKFAKEILEILDNLQRALESSKNEFENKNHDLFEGVSMTQNILMKILSSNGVKNIEALNKIFDPNLHEAIAEIEDETKASGTIVFVAQEGYSIGDRVLRAARVGIVKLKKN